ncbi:zinc finger and BTB domain-containing protein 24-like [Lampris incognitus]|uniref:zinc finger and BTB domain-containing protein 24-like n=1 Tax=Lampris incognitus TaxID=2546036 RepID=UPI0024B5AD1B|nr:zinc finger and BTB domain-containing protein 24-like [Lampris incognitus]
MEEDEEEEESMEEEEGQDNEPRSSGDYCCDVCDLRLPSNRKLQDHMNLHTGARPYFCVECGKRFCQMSTYRAHLRTHSQSKVNTFHCRICRRQFESEGGLKGHLSTTHFENKFYECDLCKRIYTNLRRCQQHVEWHKRSLANFQYFHSKMDFEMHKKDTGCWGHQEPEGNKIRCLECGQIFATKEQLKSHAGAHQRVLSCAECGKGFRLLSRNGPPTALNLL